MSWYMSYTKCTYLDKLWHLLYPSFLVCKADSAVGKVKGNYRLVPMTLPKQKVFGDCVSIVGTSI